MEKTDFLGGEVHKKTIYRGDCPGPFADLRGTWQDKWGWIFLRGELIPQCTL